MTQIHQETSPLDDAKRAQVDRALAALVDNGDCDRLVALARVVGGAQDAMSDDIVSRVSGIAAEGLDLLDHVNRSAIIQALPAISALVKNGDLERLVALSRLMGSAQDALSDDIVTRLASITAEALAVLGRATSNGLSDRLLSLADSCEASGLFPDLIGAIDRAKKRASLDSAPKGGLSGLWSLMKRRDTQEALQFAIALAFEFRSARIKSG
jgi:uncharacterized protein YjgD (DUF1641 family)